MTDTMKRWETPALGLHTLRLADVPRPIAKAGEVLVRVEAVSLNYRDGEVVGIVVGPVNPTAQETFIGIGFAVRIDVAGGAAGLPDL